MDLVQLRALLAACKSNALLDRRGHTAIIRLLVDSGGRRVRSPGSRWGT